METTKSTLSEYPSTPEEIETRRKQVTVQIQSEEHRVRESYDQILQDAYRQAPDELSEDHRESWVLEQIEGDIERLIDESRELLDPLKEELELLLSHGNPGEEGCDDEIPEQCGEEDIAINRHEDGLPQEGEGEKVGDECGEDSNTEAENDGATRKNPEATNLESNDDIGGGSTAHASSHLGKPSSTSEKDNEHHSTPLLAGEDAITKWGSKSKLREQGGILIVQTISDIERLTKGNLLSVGILGDNVSDQQLHRIVDLAWEYAEGKVQPMLPLTAEGRQAMLDLVYRLVPHVFVKVAWTTKTENGIFSGKTASDITDDELQTLCRLLKR